MIFLSSEATRAVPLWMTVHSDPLGRAELLRAAGVIGKWRRLAHYLDVSDQDIITIQENNLRDHDEQKFQMLLKWSQMQAPPPTPQDLIRIIEEEMKDSKLAQDIANAVNIHAST